MTEEEIREMTRNNYASQMDTLGYHADGNPKDMVEIVRCKDCNFWYKDEYSQLCALTGDSRPSNWFCADGKRRADDA